MVKTVYFDQVELIKGIISLHCPQGIDLDPTYGKGNFYKKIKKPVYYFDIDSKSCVKGDSRNLPFDDLTIGSIMFDPPFLATKGPSLSKTDSSNKMAKRFGVYPTEEKLHEMYLDSLKEFYRVGKPGCILIFKCQDKVSSGKQYFSHCWIFNKAVEIGWKPLDLFILCAKNRLTPKWQTDNQKHARKYHSYFWVFKK